MRLRDEMTKLNWPRAKRQPRDAEAIPRSGVGRPSLYVITIKWPAQCASCKQQLSAGSAAVRDRGTRELFCRRCAPLRG